MPPYKQQLAAAIAALDASLQPRAQQHELKRVLLQVLRPLLQHHLGGSLATFGSCSNGFWVKGSDIDACLLLPGVLQKSEQLAKLRVTKYLTETFSIGTAEVIPAQVPIAKVVGADKLSLIDVSVSNSAALCNSALVKTLAETDTRVLLLGRLLKHWASQRGINNRDIELPEASLEGAQPTAAAAATAATAAAAAATAARGAAAPQRGTAKGIGDRLQGDDPSCLPFISDSAKIKEIMKRHPKNEETVEELLRGFFHFYGYALPRLRCEGSVVLDLYDASLHVGSEEIDPRQLHAYAAAPKAAAAAAAAAETQEGLLGGPPSLIQEQRETLLQLHARSSKLFAALPRCAALAQPLPYTSSTSNSNSSSSSSSSRLCLAAAAPVLLMRCPLSRCIVNRFSVHAWASILSEFVRGHLLLELLLQQQQQEQQQKDQQQQPKQQQKQQKQQQEQQQQISFDLLFKPLEVAHKDRAKADTYAYRRFAAALARSQGLLPHPAAAAAAAATAATVAAAAPAPAAARAAARGR
ncbi:hypothetical protein, conserved [Eimeria acervulina]|uniref:Poly(A) RNA polymerase mitochondrial-like central palm domain-containing protein n=1 Tax=Eimeria acervulina TaxID=5801 RepID=U6GKX7_EIMAC|nr:hypothetical protein, conserved [Eimeria acervulina]CDI79938.1 hypothetical protein, conserved [Eimeria acervulina]